MVFARKWKTGTVYCARWKTAAGVWRTRVVGRNKREAELAERKLKRDAAAGLDAGDIAPSTTIAIYAQRWLSRRTVRSIDQERYHFTMHITPHIGTMRLDDVRPIHASNLADTLEAKGLARKSVKNIIGTLHTMYEDALFEEIVNHNPIRLRRGRLAVGKKSQRRAIRPYTREEAAQFLYSPVIPEGRRALYAMMLFGGLRCGEAVGRMWGDWDEEVEPLGSLLVHTQYDGQPLKTDKEDLERPRTVPVHPELARILTAWRSAWELTWGRRPTPKDFIFPAKLLHSHGAWKDPSHVLSRSSVYKSLVDDAAKLDGIDHHGHGVHGMRHTMITWARRSHVNRDALQVITHNPKGDILDAYTQWVWEPLCEVIQALSYPQPPSKQGAVT